MPFNMHWSEFQIQRDQRQDKHKLMDILELEQTSQSLILYS